MGSRASNPKLPGRGRTREDKGGQKPSLGQWEPCLGQQQVAQTVTSGTEGTQSLGLTPALAPTAGTAPRRAWRALPAESLPILLVLCHPHQKMPGSIIIYNLEHYQLNGVRLFDASKQLSYWEQAKKNPNLKFLEGKKKKIHHPRGEIMDTSREFLPGTRAHT